MTTTLTFSAALALLKDGRRVSRAGWNGKGMWLVLVKPVHGATHADAAALVRIPLGTFPIEGASPVHVADWLGRGADGSLKLLPFIGMKTADDGFVPWVASQTDLLAEDWEEVSP